MYFAWTDAVQLSFMSWGVVAQFSNELPWHKLQSNKAKLVLRDSQSPFRKSEQAVQCGKISGRLIMGCAPPAVTAGTQVLIGKFSSPPFYASRWVVSRPVFQHVMVQVRCTGAGISLHCCQILTLWGTDSSALSSELFPIPCSPQMAPAAPEVVSRFTSTLHQPSTILFTKSIEQTDMRQKNHLVCSKRFLCSSSLWAGWNSSPCVACVCLHALDSKIFWQSRRWCSLPDTSKS